MIYYFKDGTWTAISNTNSRYWEIKEFGNSKKLELNVPQLSRFGWEEKEDGYKSKTFTPQQFRKYLEEYRKLYTIMIERIEDTLKEVP